MSTSSGNLKGARVHNCKITDCISWVEARLPVFFRELTNSEDKEGNPSGRFVMPGVGGLATVR